jgi:chromosome segregation ATPase
MKHRVDMELLYQEVDVFRKSPSSALTEKHFLIKRFSATMVLRAREICQSARADIAGWLRTGLDPLSAQLQDRKISIERRIADLKRVGRSKETLRTRLEELNTEYRTLSADLTRLRHLQFAVATSRPSESAEAPPGPRLVRTRPAAGRQ